MILQRFLFALFFVLTFSSAYAEDNATATDSNITAAESEERADTATSAPIIKVTPATAFTAPNVWERYNFDHNLNFYVLGAVSLGLGVATEKTSFLAGGGGTFGVNFYKYFGFELSFFGSSMITDYVVDAAGSKTRSMYGQAQIKPTFIFQIPFWPRDSVSVTPYLGVGASGTVVSKMQTTRSYLNNVYGDYYDNRVTTDSTGFIISPTAKLGVRVGIYWFIMGANFEYTYAHFKQDISNVALNVEFGGRF